MEPTLKPCDFVVMNDKYLVSMQNKNKVWKVASKPWVACCSWFVNLEGCSGGYPVDGLELVKRCKSDRGKNLCPMCFNIPPDKEYPGIFDCIRERCAWWNDESQKCAIAVIADSVRKQVRK